jgi:hypothetical protein
VELYSQGAFLDDRTVRLHERECFAMSDPISYQANPETRGTVPGQFFEADGGLATAGTKATPRPTGRPRELPPDDSASAGVQFFEFEEASGAQGAANTARLPDKGEALD